MCDANQTQTPRVQSPVAKFGATRKNLNPVVGAPTMATRASLKRQQDPVLSSSTGTNRSTNIRNPGINRNHFTGRPTPSNAGINKWMNSDHLRPGKNTNVTRVARTKRSVTSSYGVNMDTPDSDELTLDGGEVSTSNVSKGHRDSNRSTLNQAAPRAITRSTGKCK